MHGAPFYADWRKPLIVVLLGMVGWCSVAVIASADDATSIGAVVHYQLPTDGPLPQTYLVTLAVTDPRDPAWIVSNFASGVVRTVTAENQGKFSETWDGLDENLMPVPPGRWPRGPACWPPGWCGWRALSCAAMRLPCWGLRVKCWRAD